MRYAFWRVSWGRTSRGVGARRARRQSATTAMAHAPMPSIVFVVGIPHSVCGSSFLSASTAQRTQRRRMRLRFALRMAAGIQSSRLWVCFLRVLALELRNFDLCWRDRVRTAHSRLGSSAWSLSGRIRQSKKLVPQAAKWQKFQWGDICPAEPSISRETSLPFVCKIYGATRWKPAS